MISLASCVCVCYQYYFSFTNPTLFTLEVNAALQIFFPIEIENIFFLCPSPGLEVYLDSLPVTYRQQYLGILPSTRWIGVCCFFSSVPLQVPGVQRVPISVGDPILVTALSTWT